MSQASRFSILAAVWFLGTWCARAQDFAVGQQHSFDLARIRGAAITITNGHIYRIDPRSGTVTCMLPSGEQLFSALEPPPVGRALHPVAVTEDGTGTLYVSDGINVHLYGSDGKLRRTFTPGLNIAKDGLLAINPEYLYVAGRVPASRGPNTATIHEIRQGRLVQSFSTPFFPGRTGMQDVTLNTDSALALDARRGLVYQLPELLYEIRVYRTTGEYVRTVSPPPEYRIRGPNLREIGRGVGLDPSDALTAIVLSDGGIVVEGTLLDQAVRTDTNVAVSYSKFVDHYDADGKFVQRLHDGTLQLPGGAVFLGIDRLSGEFYFVDRSSLHVTTLKP